MPPRSQTVFSVINQIHRYGAVSTEREPIAHPAVARAQVQNVEAPLAAIFDLRQDLCLEIAETGATNLPLPAVAPRDVLIRQAEVKVRVRRTSAFERPNLFVLANEPAESLLAIRGQRTPDAPLIGECEVATGAGWRGGPVQRVKRTEVPGAVRALQLKHSARQFSGGPGVRRRFEFRDDAHTCGMTR